MNEFSIYLCVGAINFLVCVMTMALLSHMGINYIVYTAIGYGLAICCSFFLNLKYTFNAGKVTKERFFKFILLNGTNLLLVELIQITLINHYKMREIFAIIIGMFWYTLSGYLANKFLIYHNT